MLFIGFSGRPDLPEEDKEALVEEEVGTNGLSPLIKCLDLSSFLEQFMSCCFFPCFVVFMEEVGNMGLSLLIKKTWDYLS